MILAGIIAAAVTVCVVGGVLKQFWEKFHNWIKKALDAVRNLIKAVVYGVTVFVKKTGEAIKEISKHYTKKQNQWEETVVTRMVDESEVPEEIRNRASSSYETDITKDYELVLQSS